MKTAKAHNAPQVGHCDFKPNSNEARILGGSPSATHIMTQLFKAMGWKVVTFKPKTKRKKGHKN